MRITANQLRRIIKEEVTKATRRRVSEVYGELHSQKTAAAIQNVFDNTILSNQDYIDDVQEAAAEMNINDLDALFRADPKAWVEAVEKVILNLISSDLQYRAESLADEVSEKMNQM